MIKGIIIDDEVHCIETLSILLRENCPDVQVAGHCRSATDAIAVIDKVKPDLIFLDIEMPTMNGFEMLEQFKEIPFSVIFTTGYDQYAIKAIRFSALDYLLKPIDPRELVMAVRKVQSQNGLPFIEQFRMLMSKIQHTDGLTKIAVPTSEGFELILAEEIVSCEADDNYTYLRMKNKKKIVVSRTLKDVEEQLESFSSFLRVHHSYIANLNEVTKYIRGEGGYLVMSDGTTINVSRARKDALIRRFGG